jgi:hypothetical protein
MTIVSFKGVPMKFIMALMVLFSLNAFADHHEEGDQKKMESMSFEDEKKMKLERIDKMTSMMEDHKKCINEAKDKAGLKACRSKMKETHQEMKQHMKKKKQK